MAHALFFLYVLQANSYYLAKVARIRPKKYRLPYSDDFCDSVPIKSILLQLARNKVQNSLSLNINTHIQEQYSAVSAPLLSLTAVYFPQLFWVGDLLNEEALSMDDIQSRGALNSSDNLAKRDLQCLKDIHADPGLCLSTLHHLEHLPLEDLEVHCGMVLTVLSQVCSMQLYCSHMCMQLLETPNYALLEVTSALWFRLNCLCPRRLWKKTMSLYVDKSELAVSQLNTAGFRLKGHQIMCQSLRVPFGCLNADR